MIQGATVITGYRQSRPSATAPSSSRAAAFGISARAMKSALPNNAQVIDARGKWVIPGLIDAHVHFSQSGGLYTRPDIIDLRTWRSYEKEMEWIKERLPFTFERYLASGITGVVDCGGPDVEFRSARHRRTSDKRAPRVAVAGPLIATYLPPTTSTDDPDIVKPNSPAQARDLVRRQLERQPDLIKLWWIRQPGDNLDQQVGDHVRRHSGKQIARRSRCRSCHGTGNRKSRASSRRRYSGAQRQRIVSSTPSSSISSRTATFSI